MTDMLNDLGAHSDAELIASVRGGDIASYGELFARHSDAAHRLARQLVRGPDSDDLVAEAFARMLQVLQQGGGPDVAFRAYLLSTIRRLHVDRIRVSSRVQPTDDLTPYDEGEPFRDSAVTGFESSAAAKAFTSLPERWQLVLWHLEVEGQKPADVAPLLGMSANAVSALAYRAREGLRQSFLTMHLADSRTAECRWTAEHLGAYVRKGLTRRDDGKVRQHLDGCSRCTAMYLELVEVNSNLRGLLAPVVLGAAAAGYGSAASSAGGAVSYLLGLVGRVRDVVAAHSATTVGVVAAGVTAAATAGVVVLGPQPDPVSTSRADTPGAAEPKAAPAPRLGATHPRAGDDAPANNDSRRADTAAVDDSEGTSALAAPADQAPAGDTPADATAPAAGTSAAGDPPSPDAGEQPRGEIADPVPAEHPTDGGAVGGLQDGGDRGGAGGGQAGSGSTGTEDRSRDDASDPPATGDDGQDAPGATEDARREPDDQPRDRPETSPTTPPRDGAGEPDGNSNDKGKGPHGNAYGHHKDHPGKGKQPHGNAYGHHKDHPGESESESAGRGGADGRR